MKPYLFDPFASREVRDAKEYFESIDSNLVQRLEIDLTHAFDQIRHNPQLDAKVRNNIRLAPLRRFPYSIVYIDRPEGIQIIAFAHSKRKPGYWFKRHT